MRRRARVRAACRILALCSLSLFRAASCWEYPCPAICRCSEEGVRCTRETQLDAPALPLRDVTTSLRFSLLPFAEVQSDSFRALLNVSTIEISLSNSIRRIKGRAFISLHSLSEILIRNIKNLVAIENGAFTDLPKLRYLELGDNMHISSIPSNAFLGMTEEYTLMNLIRNGFKDIKHHAFNGTKLDRLVLKGNRYLSEIHDEAFDGAVGPSMLDVSHTALHSLPTHGLLEVRVLAAHSAPALKTLPPLESLLNLQEAQFTYSSHCCAFHTWHRKQSIAFLKTFGNLTVPCKSDNVYAVTYASENMTEDSDDLGDEELQYPDFDMCISTNPIKCTPEPDAFNPCEDLLGYAFLRIITWPVATMAILGNLLVLGILLTSHRKLTVCRFLMSNLAFADLCIGVYLLLIAVMDHQSLREYYNYAITWQTGAGCGVAGFLTVFASELSIYTLTVITLERWHTITYAMQLDRKLKLRHVAAMMAAGWAFSLLAALLPFLGVSSYTKVSICLPMDIETVVSQIYVVAVLLLNVAAFLVICGCYGHIYWAVRNPRLTTQRADAKIARRMAVLIFTDFLCMAPISFFAISAALRVPLITLSHSKILLVLFYPINSLCNPFLYTIFTKAFHQDVCQLLDRCGWCQDWTERYRTKSQAPPCGPKTRASQKPSMLHFYTYHIKAQDWFRNRSPE
uniref:Luteinizing hormone/choriogonadotropin receptor n=1 Tax=Scleropages formosus TaxID=113540 RepID=A0A8C9R0A3_SCLFO